MRVRDITNEIETFAPLSTQANFDNSGLIVGSLDREICGVVIAVDLTEEVIAEAVELGVEMIVTHHPIIFSPLKRLTSANYVERCVELAIRNNLVIYAAHTNLDSAKGGLSWRLGESIGLQEMRVLEPQSAGSEVGFGVVGELKRSVATEAFIDHVAQVLNLEALRHSDIFSNEVKRVAICTGSGGSMINAAKGVQAELYITADLKYNDFFEAQNHLTILDVGHYESEYCAIDVIFDILSKKMINFALHKSLAGSNPVRYRGYPKK